MAEKLYYSMGEIAEMFDVNQSLIRHWEKYFNVLKPKRNKKGNRLFTPQDVEQLKLIYHLVKERGMTLEGARKALKANRGGGGVPRDLELLERLQHIRSLLVEVREELKMDAAEVYAARDAEPVEPVVPVEPAALTMPAAAEEPAGPSAASEARSVAAGAEQPAEEKAAEAAGATVERAAETTVEAAPAMAVEPVAAALDAPGPIAEPMVEPEPESESVSESEPNAEPVADAAPAATTLPEPEPQAPVLTDAAELAGQESSVLVFTIDEVAPAAEVEELVPAEPKPAPRPGRKSRRRKDDDDHQELFAFYEQSLF